MSHRTRIVGWLRVILPLAALAILSTLFLIARRPAPEGSAPQVRAEARALDPRITSPSWAGVTPDGTSLSLQADSATPSEGGIGGAEGLRLDWRAPDGLTATLTAPHADSARQAVTLSGGVSVATSSGWRLTAPSLVARTDASRITAEGVTAAAPFGEIDAGAMDLRREGDAHVLDFTGGVRLIYRP